MSAKGFLLTDEPWIEVQTRDGEIEEVSIWEAFHDACRIRGIDSDTRTDTAVLRLLVSILQTVLERSGRDPESLWESVWKAGSFEPVMPEIEDYLDTWRKRFDLFDPEKPFYQVKDFSGDPEDPSQEPFGKQEKHTSDFGVFDLNIDRQNSRTEASRAGAGRLFASERAEEMTPAEAARKLAAYQSYKTNKAKGGGPGPLTQYDVYMLEGRNLFETLMLNTVFGRIPAPCRPSWENEQGCCERPDQSERNGHPVTEDEKGIRKSVYSCPADVMTRCGAVVKLERDGERVTDFYEASLGNSRPGGKAEYNAYMKPLALEKERGLFGETMCAWKATKKGAYPSQKAGPKSALDLILEMRRTPEKKIELIAPDVLLAYADRCARGSVSGDAPVALKRVNVIMGTQGMKFEDVSESSVRISGHAVTDGENGVFTKKARSLAEDARSFAFRLRRDAGERKAASFENRAEDLISDALADGNWEAAEAAMEDIKKNYSLETKGEKGC